MTSGSRAKFLPASLAIATSAFLMMASSGVQAQENQLFIDPRTPVIDYFGEPTDRVADLNHRLDAGEIELAFEEGTGYLRSLLDALNISITSQIAVFSKTSLQKPLISSANPRMIFFNDEVAVAWVAGGFIEVVALDPQKGAVFYALPQTLSVAPKLRRELDCLRCHVAGQTLAIPGFLANSIPTATDGSILPWLGNGLTDHRSPLGERWGGWYVTGRTGNAHQGNLIIQDQRAEQLPVKLEPALATLDRRINAENQLSAHSDIAALLVFDHQVQMMNLLVRMSWEGSLAAEREPHEAAKVLREMAVAVVDYMLFIDEADLQEAQGSAGFAEFFNAQGPFDSKGRSLRTLNLHDRLMQYPCSYMIYSAAFSGLPETARHAVYRRLGEVLSGADRAIRYAALTSVVRREIIEILRDTKDDLPMNFAEPFIE